MKRFWPAVLLGVLLLSALFPAAGLAQQNLPQHRALRWLQTQQAADGGFSNGASAESSLSVTADAIVAIVSGGENPRQWRNNGRTPVDFLKAQVGAGSTDGAGQAAKAALAVVAIGDNPRSVAGVDLLSLIQNSYDPTTGYGEGPFDTALAILAIHAAGAQINPGALGTLLGYRLADGSYSFNGDRSPGAGDSNTTAMVVQALVAAGASPSDVQPSLAYFKAVQNDDSGWTYQKPSPYGEATDANSTALVAQALLASGQNLADWGDPIRPLLALQQDDGGFAFNHDTPQSNVLATVGVVPALGGITLANVPVLPSEDVPASGPDIPITLLVIGLLIVLFIIAAVANRTSSRP